MSPRKPLALLAAVTLAGCAEPVQVPPPEQPTPIQIANVPISLPLIDLSLPVITGGERGAAGAGGTGSSAGGRPGSNTTGTTPPTTAPVAVPARGGGGSHGGGGSDAADAISFTGHLDHPTYAGSSSGVTRVVANEVQLRAAIANTSVTNIEFSADIDLRTDGATPTLDVDRVVSISGRGTFCLKGDKLTLTATASGASLNQLTVNAPVEVLSSENVRFQSCTFGDVTTTPAVKVVGGVETTLNLCLLERSDVGLEATGGAVVTLQSCEVTTDRGATVTGATLSLSAGTFTNALQGVNATNATMDIAETRFETTGSPCLFYFTTSTGHGLTIDDATFVTANMGINACGTVPADVFVRGSRFTGNDIGVQVNYTVGTWQATIAGNTFTGSGTASNGVKVVRASTTLGYEDAWRAANTFVGFAPGLDVVYP